MQTPCRCDGPGTPCAWSASSGGRASSSATCPRACFCAAPSSALSLRSRPSTRSRRHVKSYGVDALPGAWWPPACAMCTCAHRPRPCARGAGRTAAPAGDGNKSDGHNVIGALATTEPRRRLVRGRQRARLQTAGICKERTLLGSASNSVLSVALIWFDLI